MSADVENKLKLLFSEEACLKKVGGGVVPLPSSSGGMVDHLFVNLTHHQFEENANGREMVEYFRGLAFDAFKKIERGMDMAPYATVCLSFFLPITESEGTRIYRTRIKSSDMPMLSRENLKEVVTGEESMRPEMHKWLHNCAV